MIHLDYLRDMFYSSYVWFYLNDVCNNNGMFVFVFFFLSFFWCECVSHIRCIEGSKEPKSLIPCWRRSHWTLKYSWWNHLRFGFILLFTNACYTQKMVNHNSIVSIRTVGLNTITRIAHSHYHSGFSTITTLHNSTGGVS